VLHTTQPARNLSPHTTSTGSAHPVRLFLCWQDPLLIVVLACNSCFRIYTAMLCKSKPLSLTKLPLIARSVGLPISRYRRMATVSGSLGHEERTVNEPRESKLEPVILSNIRDVNPSVRLLRLKAVDPKHSIRVSRIDAECIWYTLAKRLIAPC
jgi:hypothetical protein